MHSQQLTGLLGEQTEVLEGGASRITSRRPGERYGQEHHADEIFGDRKSNLDGLSWPHTSING